MLLMVTIQEVGWGVQFSPTFFFLVLKRKKGRVFFSGGDFSREGVGAFLTK